MGGHGFSSCTNVHHPIGRSGLRWINFSDFMMIICISFGDCCIGEFAQEQKYVVMCVSPAWQLTGVMCGCVYVVYGACGVPGPNTWEDGWAEK